VPDDPPERQPYRRSAYVATRAAELQRRRGPAGRLATLWLRARGTYVPPEVLQGRRIRLMHTGHGVVIDDRTRIGDDVVLFQGVTIGRSRPWINRAHEDGRVVVEAGAVLCAGSFVAVPVSGTLVVAARSVVAANAVLLESTGAGEIWGGIPARRIGVRDDL
jgi:serine O-acetyltransferase